MYWDDSNLTVVPYERKQKRYHCGRTLLKVENSRKLKHTLLVIDLHEAYCANVYEDGEIEKIFDLTSSVPGKHRAGGQSQRRFERIREGSITEWYKRLNGYISDIKTNMYIAINFIYQSRFEKHLTLENRNKVINYSRPEYTGLTGIHQLNNKLNI